MMSLEDQVQHLLETNQVVSTKWGVAPNFDKLVKWKYAGHDDVNELIRQARGHIWMVTGNRKLYDELAIKRRMDEYIARYTPKLCVSGMALGADTTWARRALAHGIPLLAAVPCQQQWKMWTWNKSRFKDQTIWPFCMEWAQILTHRLTTPVLITDRPYSGRLMNVRNEFMCDASDYMLAVQDPQCSKCGAEMEPLQRVCHAIGADGERCNEERRSGTLNCMEYAVKYNRPANRWVIKNRRREQCNSNGMSARSTTGLI